MSEDTPQPLSKKHNLEKHDKPLEILYQDDCLVAVNKPSGLLVHRSMIDRHETRFALQEVRNQIGQRVYPLHRLDKPTSGVLLFALSPEIAKQMGQQFGSNSVKKNYLAIVRGYAPESGVIDHALKEELDKMTDRKAQQDKPAQDAVTEFTRLATVEIPVAIDRYPQSRYSLVEARPKTGRKHQIRRHMKHIAHPIIGDAKHGKGNHNRYFATHFGADRLLLACIEMEVMHPVSGQPLSLRASLDKRFSDLIKRFGWADRVADYLHNEVQYNQ
ncbi:tRNA pseudouridine(65) synthase TruC [Endozoicomonas gorgoniicola]|uniref:tRNA pseudouridine synthase C n=1 Tax=Endozoicomonas gorgoniicola TaxID=1234144 RepID=A0ABT3N0Q8_9GAMM|nr:tRNA pseudouridine(65) synthase TruC [Endozoicomonas gorgoniicola]MCW7555211.1 tRNA pseudouridine(65) synthase TruC [Endozoicomonas gorgoniicola]